MTDDLVKDGFCTRVESNLFESKRCEKKLPRSFWETYSAFANTLGGDIVLGFTEKPGGMLELTGVSNPTNIVAEIWDLLHNRNKVSMNILKDDDVEVKEYGGLFYIVVHVPRADRHLRPIYIDNDLGGGTFRRNNCGDYHCSVPEIMEMGRDASETSSDQIIVQGTSPEIVNHDTLESYRKMLRANEHNHPWLQVDDGELLRLIGAADYYDGKLTLTRAGLLMFGKITEIIREIPGYSLSYREYENEDEWIDRLHSDSGVWSGNVFDFFQAVSERLRLSTKQPFKLDGFVRVSNAEMLEIQREALLNALAHADYFGSGGITVDFKGSELMIKNPGCFRVPVEKAMMGGHSDARNPLIMRMFDFVGLADRHGSGIERIVRICRKNMLPAPKYEEGTEPTIVRLTLTLEKGNVPIEDMVVSLMEQQPKMSIEKMAKSLNVSVSTVSRATERLKSQGRVKREGGLRGTWVVMK